MPFVIGIDVGSQSVKGVMLDPDEVESAVASSSLVMTHPHAGWAEQDPRDWESAIVEVVDRILQRSHVNGRDVGVLSLACQVDGVVAIDVDGRALGPAIIWLDRRAESQARAFSQKVGRQRLSEITGLVPDPSHQGPKIIWLRENNHAIFAAAAGFPPTTGYLVHWLTNELCVDHANASSSLLYDVRERRWSEELVEAAGLDVRLLGRIHESSQIVGTLSRRAAEQTGLSTECAVLTGTGDDHAGSIGAGAVAPGIISDITGTAEPVTVGSNEFVLDHEGLVETHAHAVPGRYLVENPGFVSGGSTLWLAKIVLKVSQTKFFELAAQAPPGSDGVVFLPALSGAMAPRWNGQMRGTFAGLAMSHTASHLARAVLEGCAFALRAVTDRFAALELGRDEIRVVGGGGQSALWMQIKADATKRPVRVVLTKEATALGAAMIAGVAGGLFIDLDDAVERTVELAEKPFLANPQDQGAMDHSLRTLSCAF